MKISLNEKLNIFQLAFIMVTIKGKVKSSENIIALSNNILEQNFGVKFWNRILEQNFGIEFWNRMS